MVGVVSIPITLKVNIGDAPVPVYEKMVKFLPPTYYLKLDKIPPTENLVSDDDGINDI